MKFSLFETKREIDVIDNKFNIKNTLWFPNARNKIVGKKQKKNDDNLLMCFLGTVSKEKGVDTLLESLDFLNESNIHINIYGPCDDSELLLLINNSKFASYKNAYCSDELANILSAHDVLCLPTRYKGEGYPGVIIESYSVGLPVIVSNWQAIPEIVQNEYQGLIFDGSALDLAKCINRVYTKKYLLDFYSENASSSFDYFDSNKLLEVYKNILVEIKNGI
ncbi:glycosyltransferase [Photobacterium leiognathi]|uniref:glycosyltransferase n=1 Tax=Photobacterium leiognathi TaxID=553611 RepID=UPI003D9FB3D7